MVTRFQEGFIKQALIMQIGKYVGKKLLRTGARTGTGTARHGGRFVRGALGGKKVGLAGLAAAPLTTAAGTRAYGDIARAGKEFVRR